MSGWSEALQGPAALSSALLQMAMGSIIYAMGALLLFVLGRLLLGSDLLAVAAIAALTAGPNLLVAGEVPLTDTLVILVWAVSWIALLLRFGLLSGMVGLFVHDMLDSLPLTTDLGSWTSAPTLVAVALGGLLAVASFRAAAGATGLRRALAGEAASRP